MRKQIILFSLLLALNGCQKNTSVVIVDGTDPNFGDLVNEAERSRALAGFDEVLKTTENISIKYKFSYDNSMLYKSISPSLVEKRSTSTSTLLTTTGLQSDSLLAVSQTESQIEYQGMTTKEKISKQKLSKAIRFYDDSSSGEKIAIAHKTLIKNGNYSYYGANYSVDSTYLDVDSYQWKTTQKTLISQYLPYTSFSDAPIYKEAKASPDAKQYNIYALVHNKTETNGTNYLYPTDATKNIGYSNEESVLLSIAVNISEDGTPTYTPTSLTYHFVTTPVTDFEFTKNSVILEEKTWTISFNATDDSLTPNSEIEHNFTWDSVTKETTSLPALYVYNSTTLSNGYDDVKTQKNALLNDEIVSFNNFSSSYQQMKGGNYHYYTVSFTKKASELASETYAIRRYLSSNQTNGYVLYGLNDKQALNVYGKCTVEYYSSNHSFFTITPNGTDASATYNISIIIDYPNGLDETPSLSLSFEANA